jgi:hypothetical protein
LLFWKSTIGFFGFRAQLDPIYGGGGGESLSQNGSVVASGVSGFWERYRSR